MKEFELNKESWHFKIATFGESRFEKELLTKHGTDICEYIRKFLRGAFTIALLTVASLAMIALVGVALHDLYMLIFAGAGVTKPLAAVIGIVTGVLVVLGMIAIKVLYRMRKEKAPASGVKPQDSFVRLAYEKFKNKTCSKIVFK